MQAGCQCIQIGGITAVQGQFGTLAGPRGSAQLALHQHRTAGCTQLHLAAARIAGGASVQRGASRQQQVATCGAGLQASAGRVNGDAVEQPLAARDRGRRAAAQGDAVAGFQAQLSRGQLDTAVLAHGVSAQLQTGAQALRAAGRGAGQRTQLQTVGRHQAACGARHACDAGRLHQQVTGGAEAAPALKHHVAQGLDGDTFGTARQHAARAKGDIASTGLDEQPAIDRSRWAGVRHDRGRAAVADAHLACRDGGQLAVVSRGQPMQFRRVQTQQLQVGRPKHAARRDTQHAVAAQQQVLCLVGCAQQRPRQKQRGGVACGQHAADLQARRAQAQRGRLQACAVGNARAGCGFGVDTATGGLQLHALCQVQAPRASHNGAALHAGTAGVHAQAGAIAAEQQCLFVARATGRQHGAAGQGHAIAGHQGQVRQK